MVFFTFDCFFGPLRRKFRIFMYLFKIQSGLREPFKCLAVSYCQIGNGVVTKLRPWTVRAAQIPV